MKTRIINKGQAVILALILFLGISLSTIFAMSGPVLQHLKISREAYTSKETFYTAEALNEDLLYRLNHSLDVGSTETLTIGGAQANANIVSGAGNKEIEIITNQDGIVRKVKSRVTTSTGLAFNYGVQAGNGGIIMANNASVIGNIYSNGDISGGEVTETAVAANASSLASDQSNTDPTTPTQSIVFRNVAASQDFAQSFQVSSTTYINKISFYIKKVGSPTNATVRIVGNTSGSPNTSNIFTTTQGTLSSNQVTINYGWVEVVFPEEKVLTAGTTYWVVIDNSTQSTSNYYEIAANTDYVSGGAKVGAYSGSWNSTSPIGLDGYFNVYIGANYSSITDTTVGDDAWAHTITGGSVGGSKYCQVGTGCDTSRPDPSPQGFPISDANIDEWKDDAAAGGTLNGFTSTSTSRLGPVKINGNLNILNGSTVTLYGNVWVTGNIQVDNGSTVKLASDYATEGGIIITDGRILIRNNSVFQGSGQSGSYILALSTSDCPTSPSCSGNNAIELSNNGGAVILYAQNGTMHLNNNAGAKEATGHKITMDNGATIQYETGFQSISFSSGPSGSWKIDSWQEIE